MKFAALKGVGGPAMGRREKTSPEKIRDGAGAASSSLSGESAHTHQGAKGGVVGCIGGSNGQDPKMANGERSGSCGATSAHRGDQARLWSHATASTSPRCAFGWVASRLGEIEAPLVALEERVVPMNKNDMIMHTLKFSKTTAPLIIGRGGRMLRRIENFCGVFLSLSDVSCDVVELTIYGPSRGCALVQFIGEMLIEGIYSVMDTLAR